jgi:O-antigen ligase
MKIHPTLASEAVISGIAPLPGYRNRGRTKLLTSRTPVPLLPALLVVGVLLPAEFSLRLGSLLLNMPRIILLVTFPVLLLRWLRSISQSKTQVAISDLALLPTCIWMFLSVSMTEGVNRAVVGASALILDFAGSYLVARTISLRPGQAVALARFTASAIAMMGMLGPLDTLTGKHIIHTVAQMITGADIDWILQVRNGLLRAQSTQDHPILMGCVCCFGILLSVSVQTGWVRTASIAGSTAGLFSALSSAPIGATILGLGLFAYKRLTPHFSSRWLLLKGLFGLGLVVVFIATGNPFPFLFRHFTLDPQTAWYRLLIWQVAGALVLQSPWFGIGMDDWTRGSGMASTVDSVWLRCAMEFGIVGSALIAVIVIGACNRPTNPRLRVPLPAEDQQLGLCLGIIAFLYIYLGFTVHFWGSTWILLGFLMGLRAHMGALAESQPLIQRRTIESSAQRGATQQFR